MEGSPSKVKVILGLCLCAWRNCAHVGKMLTKQKRRHVHRGTIETTADSFDPSCTLPALQEQFLCLSWGSPGRSHYPQRTYTFIGPWQTLAAACRMQDCSRGRAVGGSAPLLLPRRPPRPCCRARP